MDILIKILACIGLMFVFCVFIMAFLIVAKCLFVAKELKDGENGKKRS